ncbi:MAG: hypothetical protein WCH44_04020 [Betaproteobacteria bacterium]
MRSRRYSLVGFLLVLGWLSLTACTAGAVAEKVPDAVWEQLAARMPQDLIVVFDDSAVLEMASKLNQAKSIAFDDAETLRFKAQQYAHIKSDIMASLPAAHVEVLKHYESLPLMYLRFHRAADLRLLLLNPLVVNTYKDREENLMQKDSRP